MTADASTQRRALRVLGLWPVAITLLLWIAVVVWPMLAVTPTLWASLTSGDPVAAQPSMHTLGELFRTSVAWAAAVAVISALVGWLPGRLLGSLLARRGFVVVAVFVLIPLCLPAYLVFYAWWQSWPADTAVYRWVVEHDRMQLAREATLLLGLVCWSWPLAALCVAGAAARRPRARDEMLALDGASLWARLADRARSDLPGLLLGVLLVFLATLNNTTCFDLAEVFTFANELRARQALNSPAVDVLHAGLPMIAISLLGAMLVWRMLSRPAPQTAVSSARGGAVVIAATAMIWFATALLPLALFGRGVVAAAGGLGGALDMARDYSRLYAGNTVATLAFAGMSGAAALFATLGLCVMWQSPRRPLRLLAHAISMTWLLWALLPGTILGLALEMAYNRGALASTMFRSPVILILAHLSCAGFVAAFLARWSVAGEPRGMRDLRRLDGVRTLRDLWRSARPTMLAACLASAALVTVLAVAEIAVTAQVVPPLPIDQTPLSMTLLNDMHYQRPQTVLMAAALMSGLALAVAVLIALAWRGSFMLRRTAAASANVVLIAAVALLTACSHSGGDSGQALDTELTFGAPGQALGQFGYPRCLDVDPDRQCIYVIDKTARVQRFGFDGEGQVEWRMPEKDNGKPTGVSVGPNGHVYVADTHYFRVIEYDADGHEVRRFGSYGEGPGQFIYVTDIAFAHDGNLYVSEYGGNDRVQVFSPEGRYLFEFGAFGPGENHFARPQSLQFSHDGRELYIADACNHRIVVTDPQGKWLRTIGSAGREPGQLAYPYGLEVLPDDTLLVAEFGNNRIQRFDRTGKSLGVYGRVGRGEGELQYPWAVAAADDRIFVLDSGNNRVQVIDQF